MKDIGTRLDEIVQNYRAGIITRDMAITLASPLITALNKKSAKREKNTGRPPKVYTIDNFIRE